MSTTLLTAQRSASDVTTPSSRVGWGPVAARLARSHGCQAGCACCRTEEASRGVPDLLSSYEELVTSAAALRLVRHAKRTLQPLPRFSRDSVTQFLIEEALYDRYEYAQHVVSHGASEPVEVLTPHERAGAEHAEVMRQLGVG